MPQTFGSWVRDLRLNKGLTQRELAEAVERRLADDGGRGFDVSYLSKIENDRMPPPSARAILALATELGEDPDDLLALARKAPAELGTGLVESKGARVFFRSAIDMDLSEEDWERLLEELRSLKK